MRRRQGWIAILSGLSLAAAGCNALTSSNDETPQGEIVIGVTIEKGGTAKQLGDAEEKALLLTADTLNKRGVLGKKIKLVIQNNNSNPAEAAKQVASMADDPNVVGIVGPATTATALPTLPVVEQKRIPQVTMGGSDFLVSPAEKRKFTFKTPPNGTAVVEVLMREFATLGIKRVALLAVSGAFGDNGILAVTGATKRANMELTGVERFQEGDKDFSAQVGRLVAAKPQAIMVSAIMPSAAIAAKNIKDAGYQGRVYFDGGAGADLFLAGAGTAAENMYMVTNSILAANHITATTPSVLAQKEFFASYTQRYGTFSGYASFAADALSLMAEGIRKANSTDRQKVRDAIENLEYDGLTGSFKFSPTYHGGASGDGLTVLTVQKGGWVLAP